MPELRSDTHMVKIRDITGRNPDQWITLSEMNTYFSTEETAGLAEVNEKIGNYVPQVEGNTIASELSETYNAIKTQGMAQKLTAIASRKDNAYEELNNKTLNAPIINPTGINKAFHRVMCTLGEDDSIDAVRIYVNIPGTGGNAWTIVTTDSEEAEDLVVNGTAKTVVIKEGITASAVYAWAIKTAAGFAAQEYLLFAFNTNAYEATVNEIATPTNFVDGTNGTAALTSTSAEIDAVVANAHEVASVPTMAQTYATGRLTFPGAANPTDGDTITVGSKTYTFRDALAGGGQANEILICATNVPDDTCLAIQYAINASTGEGHTAFYGTGTTANQDVVATAGDNIVDLTCEGSANAATLLGTPGNAVATTKSAGLTEASFGATHLTGGLDITAANAGKIIIGSSAIYVAKAECTATSSNWETISYDA